VNRNPEFWKSQEERLREWVSDEIPFQFGESHIVFTREAIVGLWRAITKGQSTYRATIKGTQYLFSSAVYGGLQSYILAHPKSYPDDFLCQFRSFYQAVQYVLSPPDTLLIMQRAEEARRNPPPSASATADYFVPL
jgi:hypothetical protein